MWNDRRFGVRCCAVLVVGLTLMFTESCEKAPPKPTEGQASKEQAKPVAATKAKEGIGAEQISDREVEKVLRDPVPKEAQRDVASVPSCAPNCVDKTCGDDGCGGTCGACSGDANCDKGTCKCRGDLCLGSCCAASARCLVYGCCQRQCDGKSCGSDGCGGFCGSCGVGVPCVKGACAPTSMSEWPVDARTISVQASSKCRTRTHGEEPYEYEVTYGPENVLDGNLSTAWIECAKGPGIGQWLELKFARETRATAIDLYIGYQRVENDEHGDRYPFNVRPKQVKITTASHSASHQLVDKREVQRIVLDGSPIRSLRIDVEDVYLAKDKDCSFSEIVVFEKPILEGLAAYDDSFLKPGMTLVYRDDSFDYSNLEPDMVVEAGTPSFQGYLPLRLLPNKDSPWAFAVGASEESEEVMENLVDYFWASEVNYFWGDGGVYNSKLNGPIMFPVLGNSDSSRVCDVAGLGMGERVASDSYAAEGDDTQLDAQFNARYGYVFSDGAGFAGVSAGQEATLVDGYPTDSEPDESQRAVAEAVVEARLEEWKTARLATPPGELTRFYAKNDKDATASRRQTKVQKRGAELVHVPGAKISYDGLAIHIGPQRVITSFHEIVERPSGKTYVMREIEWQLEGRELLIFDQRVVRRIEAQEFGES